MDKDLKRELEKKAHEAIRRSMQGRSYKHRKWTWKQIEEGQSNFASRCEIFPWLPNVIKPNWWCRTFHWPWYCSDWERWQGTAFPYYHKLCRKCGRCWMDIRYLEWFKDK